MNKIILDKEINDLVIYEDSICNINKEININKLNIIIKDNVKFIINHYSEVINNDLYININQNNNSELIYNHSFKNNGNYNINIDVCMNGNSSKNIINIRGISDNGITNIKVDGKVLSDTKDNLLDEKVKMLNINNGKSIILPNMFIDTKNVFANHSASITNFDEDYLFYLNSKGIDNEFAKKLIIEGFLINDAK